MLRWMVLVLTFAGIAAPPAHAAPDLGDADYWAFVERSFEAIDGWWVPEERAYVDAGHRTPQTRFNAGLLTVHAIAALEQHRGLARNDARARDLADRMSDRWMDRPRSLPRGSTNSETHCWSSSMNKLNVGHASIDAQTAEALGWAWRARRALALPAPIVDRIVTRLRACASHPYWRWPTAVSTQVNWNAAIYAAAASATGDDRFLRRDFRRHAAWFARGIERRVRRHATTHLGPGYAFRYLPVTAAGHRFNSDVPAYANLTVQFIEHYDRALRAGMKPLRSRSIVLLRAWVRRLLAGSWTHAGFLNWDTGYGSQRWFSAQYWAFAQQGLIAIATSPRLGSTSDSRWAKAIFDRGLLLYRRFADEAQSPLAPARLFGVRSKMEDAGSYHMRMVVNAARAVARGLGDRESADPPPLYAFDPDTGRLAVTTQRYSTAVVPDNRGAFPYGGIELARLFGSGQTVAANVGGVPPAAFGVVTYDGRGRLLLASQRARARPLRLLRSPRGNVKRPRRYPARPYAGPFQTLSARGTVERRGVRVTSTHTFDRDAIRTRWDLRCPAACRSAHVLFPTHGEAAAIDAVLDDGSIVRLAGAGATPYAVVSLGSVRRLVLGDGYTVVPEHGPAAAMLSVLEPQPQSTNPDPGPTLAIALPAGDLRRASLTARLVPRGSTCPGPSAVDCAS